MASLSTPVALRTRARLKRKASLPPLAQQSLTNQLAQASIVGENSRMTSNILIKSPKTTATVDIKENLNGHCQKNSCNPGIELRTGSPHALTALAPVSDNTNRPSKNFGKGRTKKNYEKCPAAGRHETLKSESLNSPAVHSSDNDGHGQQQNSIEPQQESNSSEKPLSSDSDDKWNKTSISSETDGIASGDEPTVTVVDSKELRELDVNPGDVFENSIVVLRNSSSTWFEKYKATEDLRRVCIYHGNLLNDSNGEEIIGFFREEASSLRSAQCRNGLLALQDIFTTELSSSVLVDLDKTLDVLLVKSFHDLRFIASTAVKALEKLVQKHSSLQLLRALATRADSKSNKVCAEVSKCALECAKQLQLPQLAIIGREASFLNSISELECGKSVEARKPAQYLLKLLSKSVGHAEFESTVKTALSGLKAARVLKIIASKSSNANTNRKKSLRELMMEKKKAMMKANASSTTTTIEMVTR